MPMSGWDVAGAALLVLRAPAMEAAVGVLAYANRGPVRPWVYRGSVTVIGVGVLGQVGHVQEHVAQVGYWLPAGGVAGPASRMTHSRRRGWRRGD
jgi:hypothetical protein